MEKPWEVTVHRKSSQEEGGAQAFAQSSSFKQRASALPVPAPTWPSLSSFPRPKVRAKEGRAEMGGKQTRVAGVPRPSVLSQHLHGLCTSPR